MRTNQDTRIQKMLGDMARARELTEEQDFESARQAYLRLRAEAARAGIRSAHVAWGLAIACDGLGEYEAALSYVKEALELDPLAIPYRRSYDLILDNVRKTLADDSRDAADPSTPRLYELLVCTGEGDVGSHLAMVRYLIATGQNVDASRLLDAVTVLAPHNRRAWQLKAEVAGALGHDDEATAATFTASALDGREPVVNISLRAPARS